MIKDSKKFYKPSKPSKYRIVKFAVGVMCLVAVAAGVAKCCAPVEQVVPTEKDAMQRLIKVNDKKENLYLLNDQVMRSPYRDGKPILLNINFNASPMQKKAIQDVASELNGIFSVINSKYKVEVNDDATNREKLSNVNINFVVANQSNLLSSSSVADTQLLYMDLDRSIDGPEIYQRVVQIEPTVLNNTKVLRDLVAHELGHCFGLGDAYLNKNATKETIMQGCNPLVSHLSYSTVDVANLDALYRSPNNQYSDSEIADFIQNYYEKSGFNEENFIKKMVFDEILNQDKKALGQLLKEKYAANEKIVKLCSALDKSGLEMFNQSSTLAELASDQKEDFKFLKVENSRVDVYIGSEDELKRNISYNAQFSDDILQVDGRAYGDESKNFVYFKAGNFVIEYAYDKMTLKCELSDPTVFEISGETVKDYFCSLKTNQNNEAAQNCAVGMKSLTRCNLRLHKFSTITFN